jgi:plasmid stability protein
MAMLTVDLDDAEHRALKILAVRRGTSMSRIVRDLITSELAGLSEADRAAAAGWTPDTPRAVLGITGDADPVTRDGVAAAMAAAERQAEAIYGAPETGAA